MKIEILLTDAQIGPTLLRFLQSVFAEDALARIQKGLNAVFRLTLGDGNQMNVIGISIGRFGRRCNASRNFPQILGWISYDGFRFRHCEP